MVEWLWVAACLVATSAGPLPNQQEAAQASRKLLGQSVVTSVSVVMDHGNGTKVYLKDDEAEDKKPQVVGTPGTLLAPDRYEFYSFGDDGELVKKLMSLEQIQSLIAGGSEAEELEPLPVYYPQPLVDSSVQSEGVSKVLETVQNLLKGELQAVHHKVPPLPDHSWSVLLPGLYNSDLAIKDPTIPLGHDPNSAPAINNELPSTGLPTTTPTLPKKPALSTTRYTTTQKPTTIMSATVHKVTVSSANGTQESTTSREPVTATKYTSNHITSAQPTKITNQFVTKPQNLRPLTTTKRPFISTKIPFNPDSVYSKIQLLNTTKPEASTKSPAATKTPVITEVYNQSTKKPDIMKKPLAEKQKPSGIPTITHYLPITSSSPSNVSTGMTTPSQQAVTTGKRNATLVQQQALAAKQNATTTREQVKLTTTKRPTTKPVSTQANAPKLTQTTPRNPVKTSQNKPSSTAPQKPSIVIHKPAGTGFTQIPIKPTSSPQTINNTQSKLNTTRTTPSSTKNRPESITRPTKPSSVSSSPAVGSAHTATKHTSFSNSQKPIPTKKPEIIIHSSNLLGENSNIINTKIKPSNANQTITTMPRPSSTKLPVTSNYTVTQPPEKVTSSMYTSGVTPAGDVLTSTIPSMTTQHKVATITASSSLKSSTAIDNFMQIRTTESPSEKNTQTQVETISNHETIHSSTPSFHKPTTYHPQNFHTSSKRPGVLGVSSGATSTPAHTKPTDSHQALKLSTPGSSSTEQTNRPENSTSSSSQSTTSSGTTPQGTKTPTTYVTTDGTTSVQPNFETTVVEYGGVSTDDMPLQEIPLKLYESLKDDVPGTQDFLTTIMSENTLSTTGKTENSFTTANNDETTFAPTASIVDKITTMLASETMNTLIATSGSSTAKPQTNKSTHGPENKDSASKLPPTAQNNDIPGKDSLQGSASMPQGSVSLNQGSVIKPPGTVSKLPNTVSKPSGSISMAQGNVTKPPVSFSKLPSTVSKPSGIITQGSVIKTQGGIGKPLSSASTIQSSTSVPYGQKLSTAQKSNLSSTTTQSSIATSTDQTLSTGSSVQDTINLESTTNMESTTIYKDYVLQEGISAVASILLDEVKGQQATVPPSMKESTINDKFRTTSESEPTSTLATEYAEIQTTHANSGEMKSEVRYNEDAELPEKITTEKMQATATTETTKATPAEATTKGQSISEMNMPLVKKSENKPSPASPTKESKLNPDTELEVEPAKEQDAGLGLRDNGVKPPSSPSFQEKSVPKPVSAFQKKPVYQPLESLQPPVAIELHPAPYESMGLEASTAFLGEDVRRFTDLCNELAFKMWTSITGKGQIASRSLVMSPFAITSLLAMVFLGARGPTSGQMNDILRLDDTVTFNPHQVFQNVTDSVINSRNYGVATAAFVRELYSDKGKGKILDFYKERVQQYYQGHVEEVAFSMIGDIIRRRTNLLVKRQTLGKVPEYLRGSSLNMRPPLAAFSANIFQTDCEEGSTDGRDGEMYFVVRPSTRQRRLVPVPAVVWRSGFLAGYEPGLDATSVCLGAESAVSTILVLPGQQGRVAPGDGLARLEHRLLEGQYRRGGWSRLLRSLTPRPGLELQVPRFSHRSVLNATGALQRMGLRDLFGERADLRGLNGLSNELHLSDVVQVNTFSTCGEETVGARHHVETYPASPQRTGRDQREDVEVFAEFPIHLRPRQTALPDNPRLRFDRPFLYLIRHNPSGMILHMGRFNPRLLP